MKLFCDEYENFRIFKIGLKFFGILILIGMSVLFFHNMIFKNSKFVNKLHYDISDSNLENEFKIIFEELKNKNKKVDENEKRVVKDDEIFREQVKREIKNDELKTFNVETISEVKIDNNKKNLKREIDLKNFIENVNDQILESEILKVYTSSTGELDFYDI